MRAAAPPLQSERLAALRALNVLDTPRESDFDEIVELASRICDAPISVINLIDEHRQWFKAETGLGVRETPLDTSICAHVILEPGLTIIPDTLSDPRMADNPLCLGEPHLRFYAGALLKTDEGFPIGTLCVLDHRPRTLTADQRFALEVLARQVMTQMKLRKLASAQTVALAVADQEVEEMREAFRLRDVLLGEMDHRVKNSLSAVAAMLNIQSKSARSEESRHDLATARSRVLAIALLHEQLHVAARYDTVDMSQFLGRLFENLEEASPTHVEMESGFDRIVLDTKVATSLGIIVNELVTNSIKHGFPDDRPGRIGVKLSEGRPQRLEVWDTGVGGANAGANDKSTGLGMRIVQSSVEQFGGSIEILDNEPGLRTVITLPVPD